MKKIFIIIALAISAFAFNSCVEETSDYLFDISIKPSDYDMTWKLCPAYDDIVDACKAAGFECVTSSSSFILRATNKNTAYKKVKGAVNAGMDTYEARPASIEDLYGSSVVVIDYINDKALVMERPYKNKFE